MARICDGLAMRPLVRPAPAQFAAFFGQVLPRHNAPSISAINRLPDSRSCPLHCHDGQHSSVDVCGGPGADCGAARRLRFRCRSSQGVTVLMARPQQCTNAAIGHTRLQPNCLPVARCPLVDEAYVVLVGSDAAEQKLYLWAGASAPRVRAVTICLTSTATLTTPAACSTNPATGVRV